MSMASRITDLAAAVRDKINLMVPRLIPAGGTTGQIVTKTGAGNYVFGWADAPAGSGGGGAAILNFNGPAGTPQDMIFDFNGV